MTGSAVDLLQRDAADPAASVWVAASAGTGKTKVLTDRVLSLMLGGSPPTRILCLTFTRAAAAEMANRLHERLSRWAVLPEVELRMELQSLLGRLPDQALLDHARRLFATVLDAPGGLGIETIHAFCQSLLRRFPVEAGVPPHFQLLDERAAGELLADVREEVLAAAREGSVPELGAAVATLARRVGEARFWTLLDLIATARPHFRRLLDETGGVAEILARLARRLDLAPTATEAAVIAEACADAAFDGAPLRQAADAMQLSRTPTDRERSETLAAWLREPGRRVELFGAYCGVFLTKDGTRRKSLVSRALATSKPAVLACIETEAARLEAVRRHCVAAVLFETTAAVTHLAVAMLRTYERHKRSRAVLDYEDLISHSVTLLERSGVPWVMFKLDGGLDHLLIDEAQDTNPEQWCVVQSLTEEFFVGEGAHDRPRTVFAVGDAKQSIFSFQGADPTAFIGMRAHFAERAAQAQAGWRTVALETSFRSTDAVLSAIDAVFAQPAAADGVALDGAAIRHEPHRRGHAGRVELWPLVEPVEDEPSDGWTLPLVAEPVREPDQRLATVIAATIKRWLDERERLPSRDRRIRPGDIMVLMRRRTPFIAALVRALRDRGVPVAGVDRMRLTEQLAVEDMIALGNFLLLPEDDLTLATVLKGPLFGFDEERLFALAHAREGRLWRELLRRADEHPLHAQARSTLTELLAQADFMPPYELFAEILGARGGRRRLLARLGPEAEDALDEFLEAALAFEADHPPSLQGFLHWLVAGEAEVKRDLDQGMGEVRVLTVHGAKGLEAPIVILPDTTSVPNQVEPLQWVEGGVPLWLIAGAQTSVPLAAQVRFDAERRRDQEYRRLLYVAMTRAADRLMVCGWRMKTALSSSSWYELVRQGLAGAAGVRAEAMDFTALAGTEGWSGEGLVLETSQRVAGAGDKAPLERAKLREALPAWAQVRPPPEPLPPKPLAPSRPTAIEPAVRSPLGDDHGAAFQRGRLIHRLLQSLPELPPERRTAAAERFLALPVHGLALETRAAIATEALAVLEEPSFAPIFGPGSRAEVPVVGLIGNRALSGQIDRIVVTDDTVLIVDYKTLRPAPASEAEIPALYLDQLAAYVAAIAAIYPKKQVRAALLWTDGPRLMPVSLERLRDR
ncbi:MAG TPA: double-strand break repair helicase AddA [Stellaceae bacterium]|nr:double-strand break repair helicase AddA [Stellaceae bacterium]